MPLTKQPPDLWHNPAAPQTSWGNRNKKTDAYRYVRLSPERANKKRTQNMRPLLHPFRVEGGTYPVPSSHLAFISEQPQGIGGKLLVGLLTDVFRRGHPRQRIPAAFPAKPLQPPVTCFRRKRIHSTITAIELHVPAAFAAAPAAKHVQEFHLIPLFRNKDACPVPDGNRVAHLPQKPDSY